MLAGWLTSRDPRSALKHGPLLLDPNKTLNLRVKTWQVNKIGETPFQSTPPSELDTMKEYRKWGLLDADLAFQARSLEGLTSDLALLATLEGASDETF
jgi:hypothetical protein